MGLVLRQLVEDHGRLRRVVEIVLDLLDLGDLRQFGDVERAVLEGEAVRPIEAGGQHLDLALAVLVDDGIDLVDQAAADKHRALVAHGERARIRHAGGIDLDVEAGRHLQLRRRQFVRRGGNRRRRDRRELGGGFVAGGRPINGEPGGSAGAAAGGAPAAGGGAAGCWAAAPSVNALRKTPASNRLRGVDEWLIMGVLPWRKPVLYTRHMGGRRRWLSGRQSQYFSVKAQPETCVTETALAEWPARRRPASSHVSAS